MARKYKYQINSKRGIVKAVERPAGTTPIRESKGAYDPKATYSKGDTVIYGGLYYTATTGTGIPGEGDGWEISGIVSAKGVTLSIRLSKPVLDVSDGAKAVTATATATLGGQDITTGLPADGWRWTWRGKELSGETKSSVTLTDIPTEVGQYPLRATHRLFGTYAEEQVVRVDVTSKLRTELEGALEQLRKSTGEDQAAMAEVLGKVNKTLTSLQEQVDNEVSNWFYPGAPAPDKEPESEWITNQDKYRHIGDTYTSVDESGEYMGKSWRYTTEYKWQEIHDTLISKALSVAAKAQTTADGKSTTYYTQPARYSVGDSWVLSADTTVGGKVYKKGTMLFANSSSDVYVGAHWGERLKYIDSAKLDADLKASEAKSKDAWEKYANAKASKAGEDALKAAKEYAEAQDAAYETRTKAYADKIVTDKEQALIAAADAKAAAAETRAKAYADGKVTEAEQLAIDKADAAYQAAIKRAKELDGEIQVGGRNLLRPAGYGYGKEDTNDWRKVVQDGNGVLHWTQKDGSTSPYQLFTHNRIGKGSYTLSFKANVGEGFRDYLHFARSNAAGETWLPAANDSTTIQIREKVWLHTVTYNDLPANGSNWINYYGVAPSSPVKEVTLWSFKLERGTVATDWTPAPEDVQAEIDKVERGYQKLIERVDVEFAVSTSRTTAPVSGWQTTAPTTTKGQALWQRTKVYLKDGTTEVRGTTCIQGRDGRDGTDGTDGKDGTDGGKGADGRGISDVKEFYYLSTSNTELKGGVWSETAPTPKDGCWIWTMTRIYYTTGTHTSTKPVCVTGEKGEKGDTGAKGEKGDPGVKGDRGEKGDGLDIIDTRNDNQPPSWYRKNHPYTTSREFKILKVIGIPSEWWIGTYCTLETTVRWENTSGGRVEQSTTLDNGTQLRRVGTADDTAWEQWLNVSAQVKAVEQGLASAKTTIATLEQAKKEIEKGKLSISDLPKNLKWIYDAFHHGETQVEGGLILSKYIGLSNSSDKVTSYISGEDGAGAHMLAAGVTSLADQDAVSFINYDGSAKFGELEIDKNGWVMISNVGRNKRLDVTHITSDAVCFEDHTGGRWRSTKAHIGMSADGDAMEIIVDGGTAITLSKKGVHVNSFDDRLMPRVLAHGKFDKSGRLSKAIAYNDPNTSGVDSRFSCSRVSEGKYRLTFPGEWLNPWSTLVFQGTEQDSQSGQSARFVSFGPATRYGGSAYVYVFGADDRNLRDVSVYFQIIAL